MIHVLTKNYFLPTSRGPTESKLSFPGMIQSREAPELHLHQLCFRKHPNLLQDYLGNLEFSQQSIFAIPEAKQVVISLTNL